MNPNQTAAYRYLEQAQQARKAGDKHLARKYAEQAARLAPELEDVWLMMAALASPRASIVFLEKALQINPNSERVRQGMHWAVNRLRTETPRKTHPPAARPTPAPAKKAKRQSRFSFAMLSLTAMCLVVLASAVWAVPSMASTFNIAGDQNSPAWAAVDIAKPTYTIAPSPTLIPTATSSPTATSTPVPTSTSTPTETSTPLPTNTPTITPTEAASPTLLPSDTAYPTPTALPTNSSAPVPTKYVPPASSGNGGERWIDVDLTHQMVYAYEGNTIVNSFLVSTGTWLHPTVTGQYHIYIKYRYKDMSGPGYFLPNVPYTMFFYEGYALHGTYWHSNFGTPMSHGCVNLSIPDSEWLYNWASVGTLVNVHY